MTNIIPAHNHCMICMKAIPASETLCSDECKQKYQKMLKKKRYTLLFLWVMIIAVIAVLFYGGI
jgi:predicted nucleic acid-binding Zn ribbon protein